MSREFDEFLLQLKADLNLELPKEMDDKLVISDVEVTKMNDQKLHGLVFKLKDVDEAPTFYIDDSFKEYRNGRSTRGIAAQLAETYMSMPKSVPFQAADLKLDYESIKEDIDIRVIEKNRNKDFLKDRPYVDVGNGLVAVFYIERGSGYSIGVNDSIAEDIGIDTKQMYEIALKNTIRIQPPTLIDMSSALFGGSDGNLLERSKPIEADARSGMYVLSNSEGCFGATSLMLPGVIEKAAYVLGDSCYVLPSSLHEVILVPESTGPTVKELSDMVRTANQTVVEPKDVLSDEVYHYDLYTHSLSTVTYTAEHKAESVVAEKKLGIPVEDYIF